MVVDAVTNILTKRERKCEGEREREGGGGGGRADRLPETGRQRDRERES